ncbi:hypothetical protein [Nocardia lijiangensis]|uniref:hypothetical protein n=1 Tax=Nocardia lijiangensis TaxID=299618 RepID=UPI003D75FFF9
MVRRRSPQEKKALSYVRDRRNDYGENDKSSRKNIPRTKRILNRVDRRCDREIITATGGHVDLEAAEQAELELRTRKSKWSATGWRKRPDTPLGEVVAHKLRNRVARRAPW